MQLFEVNGSILTGIFVSKQNNCRRRVNAVLVLISFGLTHTAFILRKNVPGIQSLKQSFLRRSRTSPITIHNEKNIAATFLLSLIPESPYTGITYASAETRAP